MLAETEWVTMFLRGQVKNCLFGYSVLNSPLMKQIVRYTTYTLALSVCLSSLYLGMRYVLFLSQFNQKQLEALSKYSADLKEIIDGLGDMREQAASRLENLAVIDENKIKTILNDSYRSSNTQFTSYVTGFSFLTPDDDSHSFNRLGKAKLASPRLFSLPSNGKTQYKLSSRDELHIIQPITNRQYEVSGYIEMKVNLKALFLSLFGPKVEVFEMLPAEKNSDPFGRIIRNSKRYDYLLIGDTEIMVLLKEVDHS